MRSGHSEPSFRLNSLLPGLRNSAFLRPFPQPILWAGVLVCMKRQCQRNNVVIRPQFSLPRLSRLCFVIPSFPLSLARTVQETSGACYQIDFGASSAERGAEQEQCPLRLHTSQNIGLSWVHPSLLFSGIFRHWRCDVDWKGHRSSSSPTLRG